jgi:hypothetical protein
MKLSSPKQSGNSTSDTPLMVMQAEGFSIEIGSNTEDDDKKLTSFAKKLRQRNNAYDGMLMELEESLKDLTNWDGTPEAMEIIKENIADRIKKAKRGAKN